MERTHLKGLQALLLALALLATGAVSALEGEADRLLREMGEYLKTAPGFRFQADIEYDTKFTTGESVRYAGESKVTVRRPDRLHVAFDGDEHRRQVFYDGSTVTLLDALRNLYAVTGVPGEIDGALDLVFEKFGLTVPLADLVYADPYAVLTEEVDYGAVVGIHRCGDARCHHLVMSQEDIDWEIWIETGPQPLPRKLLISYKNAPGSPRYEARLSGWEFAPRVLDTAFVFHPPHGASEIEFLPAAQEPAEPAAGEEVKQ
jgi:hypothetical protein